MKRIFTIIIGLVFVGIGIYMMIRGNDMAERCTAETTGTVVNIQTNESIDSDGRYSYTYYPVVEYEAEGVTVRKQYSVGSGNSKYSVNDKIKVLYDPQKIEDYIIEGDSSSKIFSIVFIAMGGLVAVLGIFKRDLG